MDSIEYLSKQKEAALRRLSYHFDDLKKQMDTYDAKSYPVKYAIEAYKEARDAFDTISAILANIKANCKD